MDTFAHKDTELLWFDKASAVLTFTLQTGFG